VVITLRRDDIVVTAERDDYNLGDTYFFAGPYERERRGVAARPRHRRDGWVTLPNGFGGSRTKAGTGIR